MCACALRGPALGVPSRVRLEGGGHRGQRAPGVARCGAAWRAEGALPPRRLRACLWAQEHGRRPLLCTTPHLLQFPDLVRALPVLPVKPVQLCACKSGVQRPLMCVFMCMHCMRACVCICRAVRCARASAGWSTPAAPCGAPLPRTCGLHARPLHALQHCLPLLLKLICSQGPQRLMSRSTGGCPTRPGARADVRARHPPARAR